MILPKASEEGLQIAVKRTEAKTEGEKERYTHLNSEFQIIARRDKKAFFSDQCKEIEENNRIGRTRDIFKKIRYTKGTFHAKMGSIKDRIGMGLTEAEDIIHRDLIGGLVTKSCPPLATLWTVACRVPLSMEFSRQEYCSGFPFPSPRDLPDPGIEPKFP